MNKGRTHASTLPLYCSINRAHPSSLKSSSFPYKASLALVHLLVYAQRNSVVNCGKLSLYTLSDVYQHYLRQPFESCHDEKHKDSAVACSKVLQHCASSKSVIFTYDIETATPCLAKSNLAPLCASLDQRPDVLVSRGEDTTSLSLVEIHSSPYEDTIRKSIVTGLDLLRLRRTFSNDTTALTTFAFPNLKEKQCVVKVQLRWENLFFKCFLTPIYTIEEIEKHLLCTFSSFPSVIPPTQSPCKEKFVLRLSDVELGEGSSQEPSHSAIIVRNQTWAHKKPFWYEDEARLQAVCLTHLCAGQNGASIQEYAVILETESIHKLQFFRYYTVCHNPMSDIEVNKCQFYARVHTALEKVHNQLRLVHMDIRLNNICFNNSFQPIFIDFDCALPINASLIPLAYGESCMYPGWVDQLLIGFNLVG